MLRDQFRPPVHALRLRWHAGKGWTQVLVAGACLLSIMGIGAISLQQAPVLYLQFLPVLVSAHLFRAPGGLTAGLLAGVLAMRALPDSWVLFTGAATGLGGAVGVVSWRLNRRLEANEHLLHTASCTYARTLRAIAATISVREDLEGGHCERVAYNALAMGKALGFKPQDLNSLYWAGLLHDLGKLAVPEEILLKPGRLTKAEYAVVQQHAAKGADMLLRVSPAFAPIAAGVRSHHEHWDGRGYPDGLKGAAIPIFGRILAVVDVFEALTSRRPYHAPLPPEQALAYLREYAATHFDPELVPVFEALYRAGEIQVAGRLLATHLPVPAEVPVLSQPQSDQSWHF